MKALLFLATVCAACTSTKSSEHASGDPPAPSAIDEPVANAADLQAPARAKKPMKVTAMHSTGFLRTRRGAQKTEERLPGSPYKSGEYPQGVYAPGDGSVFVVGKLYTGKPGPDHGVVYRRTAHGEWSIEHILEERTFHTITGRGPKEIYIGAIGGVVHFDGDEYAMLDLPYPMVNGVWRDGNTIIAQAFDGSATFELADGEAAPSRRRVEPKRDPYSFDAGDTHYQVFERSVEVGERTLSKEEEKEMRDEIEMMKKGLDDGSLKVRRIKRD